MGLTNVVVTPNNAIWGKRWAYSTANTGVLSEPAPTGHNPPTYVPGLTDPTIVVDGTTGKQWQYGWWPSNS